MADKVAADVMTLENFIVRTLDAFPPSGMTGRRKILTTVKEITRENVRDVLGKTLNVHAANASEIQYLYDVYRGKQDVLSKRKLVRENINNKVVVNRANEIVTFKTSFLLGEPVRYISHGGDDNISEAVNEFNEYMRAENKDSGDKEVVDWIHICGVCPRLVLPESESEYDGAPFHVYTLDPREAFVIYSAGIGHKPLAGVILQKDEEEKNFAMVYTRDWLFTVTEYKVLAETNEIGIVPIVEYIHNMARQGAFEIVLPLLNSINTLESNAVDSVEDFVNGFDVFQNCQPEDGQYGQLNIGGKALIVKTVVPGCEAKVYRIFSEISQTGVQTRIDDQTSAYLEICGMPNRNGGSSTSDTGAAVILRDGFSAAMSRAKDTATLFKRAEREFDKIALRICDRITGGRFKLDVKDFDVKFPFGNLENIQTLTQTFCELLNQNKLHPRFAFEAGAALFKDPEEAYRVSMEYYQENQARKEEELNGAIENERERALRAVGQDDSETQPESAETSGSGEVGAAD